MERTSTAVSVLNAVNQTMMPAPVEIVYEQSIRLVYAPDVTVPVVAVIEFEPV